MMRSTLMLGVQTVVAEAQYEDVVVAEDVVEEHSIMLREDIQALLIEWPLIQTQMNQENVIIATK